MPIADETIMRFELLRRWRDEGKVWVTSTSRLLEWTRVRTFLRIACRREAKRLVVELNGVDDPIFGCETIGLEQLNGLSFRLRQTESSVIVSINGRTLSAEQLRRQHNLCWLDAGNDSPHVPRDRNLSSHPKMNPSSASVT
jgi:hypothetical protein